MILRGRGRSSAESLPELRDSGHRFNVAIAAVSLGVLEARAGDVAAARAWFAEGLAGFREVGHPDGIALGLVLAAIAAEAGHHRRVVRLVAAATRLQGEARADLSPLSPVAPALIDGALARARCALGGPAYAAAWDGGWMLTLAEALAEGGRDDGPRDADAVGTPALLGRAACPGLTPRQVEVLGLLAEGRSSREIAAALGIGRRTVERHLTAIYTATGVDRRAGAIAYALRHGIAPQSRGRASAADRSPL